MEWSELPPSAGLTNPPITFAYRYIDCYPSETHTRLLHVIDHMVFDQDPSTFQ